jgi:hypothetical protein
LESIIRLIVAVIITTATELTIQWNQIFNVEALDSAGQLIPLLLGIGAFIRVCYVSWRRRTGENEDEDDDDGSWSDE